MGDNWADQIEEEERQTRESRPHQIQETPAERSKSQSSKDDWHDGKEVSRGGSRMRLDTNHGFFKDIVRNQERRKSYHEEYQKVEAQSSTPLSEVQIAREVQRREREARLAKAAASKSQTNTETETPQTSTGSTSTVDQPSSSSTQSQPHSPPPPARKPVRVREGFGAYRPPPAVTGRTTGTAPSPPPSPPTYGRGDRGRGRGRRGGPSRGEDEGKRNPINQVEALSPAPPRVPGSVFSRLGPPSPAPPPGQAQQYQQQQGRPQGGRGGNGPVQRTPQQQQRKQYVAVPLPPRDASVDKEAQGAAVQTATQKATRRSNRGGRKHNNQNKAHTGQGDEDRADTSAAAGSGTREHPGEDRQVQGNQGFDTSNNNDKDSVDNDMKRVETGITEFEDTVEELADQDRQEDSGELPQAERQSSGAGDIEDFQSAASGTLDPSSDDQVDSLEVVESIDVAGTAIAAAAAAMNPSLGDSKSGLVGLAVALSLEDPLPSVLFLATDSGTNC